MRRFVSKRLGTMALGCALIGLAVGNTGCKKLVDKLAKLGDAGTRTGTGAQASDDPAMTADDMLRAKVDEYIQHCTNNLSSSILRSRDRYYDWVDPKVGPPGRRGGVVYGLYEVPDKGATECAAAVQKAKAMTPADAKLEAAADAYAKAATDLGQLIPVAYKYYEEDDYKDDKFAKGKQLHPQLVAAWDAFAPANTALHQAIDGIVKPMDLRDLARVEQQEGKAFTYHRKNTLIQARTLIEASDPKDGKVTLADAESAFAAFEGALTGLETYGTAHAADLENPKLRKTVTAKTGYSQFVSAANDYRKEAKGLLRCLRDAPAKAKTQAGKIDLNELPRCSDGDDVADKYNRLIQTANSWQF